MMALRSTEVKEKNFLYESLLIVMMHGSYKNFYHCMFSLANNE